MHPSIIGMNFQSFLTLLIISLIVSLIVHYALRYRFLDGSDGFLSKWVVSWLGAWLGTPVLGDWFSKVKIAGVYIIPAVIGAFVGAFLITAAWKADAKAIDLAHRAG